MEQTKIEWTATRLPDGTVIPGYTANFWWGCQKVSPACTHCYAETWAKRMGKSLWGPTASRERQKSIWSKLPKWNKDAATKGYRPKVFVESMSDIFEDHPSLTDWRREALELMEECTNLDFLMLTKRPENIGSMIPLSWCMHWPAHVWAGTTVENQEYADKRIPHLLTVPAAVRFLSCEPLLGPVDLTRYLADLHWVIAGGESGHGARPMHPDWVRSLRNQCEGAGVPFFFKQWGEFVGGTGSKSGWIFLQNRVNGCGDKNTHEWDSAYISQRVGKKAAGRLLDGVEWSQMPVAEMPV